MAAAVRPVGLSSAQSLSWRSTEAEHFSRTENSITIFLPFCLTLLNICCYCGQKIIALFDLSHALDAHKTPSLAFASNVLLLRRAVWSSVLPFRYTCWLEECVGEEARVGRWRIKASIKSVVRFGRMMMMN